MWSTPKQLFLACLLVRRRTTFILFGILIVYGIFNTINFLLLRSQSGITANFEDIRNASIYEEIVNPRDIRGTCIGKEHVHLDEALVQGYRQPTPGYLTIGIPTIKRPENKSYIMQTINSLLENADEMELNNITIVIFCADLNKTLSDEIINALVPAYSEYISRGIMQIITAPACFYPSLENLKRTYNQAIGRVKWRSKQNFDFAYLMFYSLKLSTYYLQLEDDVIAAENYFSKIKSFINSVKTWTCLEFSELGFIGKLYRTPDLEKLAKMLLIFWEEQPNDVTYLHFNKLMLQQWRYIRKPTIFQHMGTQSSLKGKYQGLKDQYFSDSTKEYPSANNPKGNVTTTMKVYGLYTPELAYSTVEGKFWTRKAGKGDVFNVLFNKVQWLNRIIVKTGSKYFPKDIAEHARLEVGSKVKRTTNATDACQGKVILGEFKKGNIEVNMDERINFGVQCLQIVILENQPVWLIIREVAVFIDDVAAAELKYPSLYKHMENVVKQYPDADNPTATISTNMNVYGSNAPELAYGNKGVFWAKFPSKGAVYNVVFDKPHLLKRVIVNTGSKYFPFDIAEHAQLEVGSEVTSGNKTDVCHKRVLLGELKGGNIDVDISRSLSDFPVSCIKLTILEAQIQWIILNKIAVYLATDDDHQVQKKLTNKGQHNDVEQSRLAKPQTETHVDVEQPRVIKPQTEIQL